MIKQSKITIKEKANKIYTKFMMIKSKTSHLRTTNPTIKNLKKTLKPRNKMPRFFRNLKFPTS